MLTLRGISGHEYDEIFIPLHGAHQAQNAALALAAVEGFFGVGTAREEPLDIDKVRGAFSGVSSPGRLEVIRRSPTIVLDAAHNPAGARATADAIGESFGFSRLVGVIGTSGDKDSAGLLEALEPVLAEVVISRNSTQRASDIDKLAETAVEIFGADRVLVEPRLDDAIDAAVALAEEVGELGGSGVLITGSIITVGEARILLSPR
jgi:dihydrofolate synthase/folylpolyglutamate synthase